MIWCCFWHMILKTPLTSIVAYLSMLDGYPKMPEEERKKYIHIALEKSNRLGELINEFFDITRYNLQNIELEPVKINLTMMLEQIADELMGFFRKKSSLVMWTWKRIWRFMAIRTSLPVSLIIF